MSSDFSQDPYQSPQTGGAMHGDPYGKVAGPAIGIMVVAGIGIFFAVLALILNVLGVGLGAAGAAAGGGGLDPNEQAFAAGQLIGQGVVGIVQSIVGIAIGSLCLFGAIKMKSLESYGLAMTAAVLVMVPCLSPCCVLGLPVGIWAVVVLNDPLVKSSFRG